MPGKIVVAANIKWKKENCRVMPMTGGGFCCFEMEIEKIVYEAATSKECYIFLGRGPETGDCEF